MKKIRFYILLIMVLTLSTWGCATLPARDVSFCENRQCNPVQSASQRQELLGKLYTLLKNNLNRDIDFYRTTPQSRDQSKRGFGFYLQGGPMPGWAVLRSIKLTDILYIDRENFEIKFKVDPDFNWNGMPCFSTSTEGTLSVKDNNQIKYSATYFVSWMVVGTSVWKHEMMFDYIDFDKSLTGSFYSIGGGGPLCAGKGSGYALAKFPADIQSQPEPTIVKLRTVETSPDPGSQPILDYKVTMTDAAGGRILEGGQEAVLTVEIANNGNDAARGIQILLSGYKELVGCFGEKHMVGNIASGEKKSFEFKTVLPYELQAKSAGVNVEILEGRGFSPTGKKSVEVSLRSSKASETVEIISQLPKIDFSTQLRDQNNNRIIDGGEEIILKVDVRNTGSGIAKDVQIALSGNRELISCLGEKRVIGDIRPGEQKSEEFKAILPAQIPPESASLRIEILEGRGSVSVQRKTLQIAMRPTELPETIEVISEVDVDDIPEKIKGYERKDAVALIIGIGKYREDKIPAVKYAARDAEVMAKYFENLSGIPKANIQVLTDEKASKSDIQAYIEDWLPRRVNENSTVFIYYSGHGAPDLNGKDAFIVPYEGRPDFPSQLYPLRNLYESLGRLRAREVVVLLDSCFSGLKGRSVMSEGARPLVMTLDSILPANNKVHVIAGAAGNQISSDYDRAKHGLFTYYILRGMRGEADEKRQGIVNFGALYNYVRRNVAEKASLELNRDQTPVLLPPDPNYNKDRLNISVVRTR